MFSPADVVRIELSEAGSTHGGPARRHHRSDDSASLKTSGRGSMGRACSFAPTVHSTCSTSAITGSRACSTPPACRLRRCSRPCRSSAARSRMAFRPGPVAAPATLKLESLDAKPHALACLLGYDRTRPLIDGRIKPEDIDLDIQVLRPRVTFQRMLDKQEFQSPSCRSLLRALIGRGECPFVAVPVVLSKFFRHSASMSQGAGIERRRTCAASGLGRPIRRHRAGVHARHAAARLRHQPQTCTGTSAG